MSMTTLNPGVSDTEQTRLLINKTFAYMATLMTGIFIIAMIFLLVIKE